MTTVDPRAWPYPTWVAHRGAGRLAPENTLAAFRLGRQLGWSMAECDVRLSRDGVPFLLHDDRLDRCTDGHGPAAQHDWEALRHLDAGRWHGPTHAGEPLLALDALQAFCEREGLAINLELKPAAGDAWRTGDTVAAHAAGWRTPLPPLLSSFSPLALAAARSRAPMVPRGLLLSRCWQGWESVARDVGVCLLGAHQSLWNAGLMAQARAHGWRTLAYTVNQAQRARTLRALGLDMLVTDRVDRFSPASSNVEWKAPQRPLAIHQATLPITSTSAP